ncbi:MAG: VCBS repeat-containing protein, partial [Gammaproteobacteria bacterium]|nr:VCBS repeat-containing protein [Gammaproteobacteria bacterium]
MIRLASITQTLAGIGLMISCAAAPAAELSFNRQEFKLPLDTEKLVVADLNGDGLFELLAVVEKGLQIYFQTEDGFDFDNNTSIEFPGQSVGWDLSTQYGAAGSTAIIALIDGKEVLAWSAEAQTLLAPQIIR